MNKIITLAFGLLLIAAAYYLYTTKTAEHTSEITTYATAQTQFTVERVPQSETVMLSFNGRQYELKSAVSASGDRYTNADESVVFWEKGGEALVEIDGEIVVKGAVREEKRVEVLKSNKQGDPDANKYDVSSPTEEPSADETENVSTNNTQLESATLLQNKVHVASSTKGELEVENATKATDYNSSRSNKSY